MALVKMKTLLERAQNSHRGVGTFSVGNMEMVKGAIQAAEELNTPIILQIAEVRLKHSPLSLMGPMMVQAAREAKVDVAVHLDHGLTMDVVEEALELGFTSVMFDSSLYPFEENMMRTRQVVELARQYGAAVEAEKYLKSEGAHNYFDLNTCMVRGTYENVKHHIEVFNCGLL